MSARSLFDPEWLAERMADDAKSILGDSDPFRHKD